VTTQVDLEELLDAASHHVKGELSSKPDVVQVGDDLDLGDLAVSARRWAQVDEVVALVADLKDSTRLSTGKHAASTASIYEAAIAPAVQILSDFDADDIDIQGDCAIGVFWGWRRMERAFCAGVTIKTFSERHLEPQLEAKWPKAPATGFKIGLAASRILVKRVGVPRKPDYQEEVWVGRAVNYAAKAAQNSNRHEMWVTGSVWDRLESSDYIAYTCGCPDGEPRDTLWDDVEITRLPGGDQDRYGRMLTSMWCVKHGAEFCNAILEGETKRSDVGEARAALNKKLVESAIANKRRAARQQRLARLGPR
jgi:class 3 adenylate cyclase